MTAVFEPAAVDGAPQPAEPMVPMPLSLMLRVGTAAYDAGRLPEAEGIASNLLRATPQDGRVLQLAALITFRTGREALGIQFLEQAIALAPQESLYHRNISEMYRQVGRLDDALAAANQAVSLASGDPIALHNLGVILHQRGEIERAIVAARRAVLLQHDRAASHFALAEAHLLRGEMAEGWERYEWRFRIPGVPSLLPAPFAEGRVQWGGARLPPGQAMLLVGDQGFGDVIQFSRYIPWAQAQTDRLVLALSREMAPLIGRLFPDIDIRQRWADCPEVAYCALSSLPRLHGTRLDSIPPPVPIVPEPAKAAAWAERLAQALPRALPRSLLRVGLVWAGRPTHKNDRNRSIPFQRLVAALGGVPGIALISLQKGERAGDVAAYEGAAPLFDAAPHLSDYDETAACIAALDLVITVDTSVAHLAGAMGAPTWVLLPHVPDWRWLQDREDSPWYASVRLFRQSQPFDWTAPIGALVQALGARVEAQAAVPAP